MPLTPGRWINTLLALVLQRKMMGSHSRLHTRDGCTDDRRWLRFVLVNVVCYNCR
jgi:hypothetical protein